ncbi:MAG TPA: DJ-1/PfpI family protein [Trichormus sp.]
MAEKRLEGIRVLMVIAPEEFRDEELLTPKQILADAGAKVDVASTRDAEATGMLGATVTPDLNLANAKSQDYQAAIVVGGMGSPEHLWNEPKLHAILQDLHKNGSVVAAICLSGAVLANAGVLSGKKATVYSTPESLQALSDGRAHFTDEPVVQDGKIITANGPEAAQEFGEKIVNELSKVKV